MALGSVLQEFGVKLTLAWDDKKASEASRAVDKLGGQMRSLAFDVAGAAAAILGFANTAGQHARNLQNQSDMLGITTEKLQEMEYAARTVAGVSRDELVGSMMQVSQTIDQFRHGNIEAGQGLLRLAQAGVGEGKMLEMLQNKYVTADKVVEALSDSFKNIKDPMAAVRLATEAGGGAMAKLLPLLKQGSGAWSKYGKEAHASGLVDSNATIKSAARMEMEMVKLWQIMEHLSYTIGYELLKYIIPLVKQFEHWVQTNKKFIAANIVGMMKGLAAGVMVVFKAVAKAADIFMVFVDKVGGAENAAKILLTAFLAFKTITFFVGLVQTLTAVVSLFTMLTPIVTGVVALFEGLQGAFTAFSMIAGLADVLPALGLAFGALGTGLAATLLPILGIAAAIGAVVVGVHDIWSLMNGEPTWTGKALDKVSDAYGSVKEWFGGGSESAKGVAQAQAMTFAATPSPLAANVAGEAPQQQFNFNNTFTMPPGTTAAGASAIITKANVDSHDKIMMKAKNDATRARNY